AERLRAELPSPRVRVLVGADEELVLAARRLSTEEIPLRAQLLAEKQRGPGLPGRALGRDVHADAALPRHGLEQLHGALHREPRADALRRVAAPLARPLDPVLVHRVVREPAL